jgi:hypothetical protein
MEKIFITENIVRNILKEISEEKKETEFQTFAKKRYEGAKKIAENAKSKGGPAMLSYHHFIVKLPHYKKAYEGKFDMEDAKNKLAVYMKKVCSLTEDVNINQTEFQRLVGLIEVLGELIIKYK